MCWLAPSRPAAAAAVGDCSAPALAHCPAADTAVAAAAAAYGLPALPPLGLLLPLPPLELAAGTALHPAAAGVLASCMPSSLCCAAWRSISTAARTQPE
jgi:hypothetical protein